MELDKIDKNFILSVSSGAKIINNIDVNCASFSVDSRTLVKGDIFIALKGKENDAHNFIEEAYKKGASGFILEQSKKVEIEEKYKKLFVDKTVVYVDNTLQFLLDLAAAWRKKFNYQIVAITGSVGKTTTKKIIANILAESESKADYLVSYGNQNTLIGVALNILKLRLNYKAAIFEVGIKEKGVMEKIANLLQPTIGVIINIGHSHMEGLGLLADIAEEKRQIFKYFKPENIVIINGDQELLTKYSYSNPVLKFGFKTLNQIQARKVVVKDNITSFVAKIYNKKYDLILKSVNSNYVLNCLAAISIAKVLNIDEAIILKGIEKELCVERRFEIKKLRNGALLIDDAYNANPESVKAALIAFKNYKTTKKKIVVLGDMLGLGELSEFWHRHIGRFFNKIKKDVIQFILVGPQFKSISKLLPFSLKASFYSDLEAAKVEVQELLKDENSIVFFKASNGMKFDTLLKQLN